jgi:hypothetical protein
MRVSTANLEGVKVKRALGVVLAVLIVLYAADYAAARFGFPGNRPTFGSVEVRRSYAVPQKNKKLEYYFDPPESQACVNSLFPHFDVQPCWYLSRHKTIQIAM